MNKCSCDVRMLISVKTINHVKYDTIFTAATPKSRANITYEDLKKYFIEYNPHMPAKLDRAYELWANAKGADCEECLLIANLFNQAIDSAKTGLHFTPQITVYKDCLLIYARPTFCLGQPSSRFTLLGVQIKSDPP